MKTKLSFLLFFICFSLFAQSEDAWLFLKDKPNAATFLANPINMLSQRAIDRRKKLQVTINETDVPIHNTYLETIKNTTGITVLGKSKWLNAVHIQGTKSVIDGAFPNLSFVKRIEFANKSFGNLEQNKLKKTQPNQHVKFKENQTDFTYGNTSNQIKMLGGDYLHKQGLTGNGQIIAVIDAGFPNVNTLSAFKRLRDNNKILGGYDFVNRSTNFYSGHNHGTNVLSTIGGYLENQFVGSAPDASFYLFRTEDSSKEVPLEETLWVEAAERADSLGVDVINTSLGYTTFDNSNYNYSYKDMDGKTTFISRGAEIAANKGILVVNAAGNEGNNSWKYISAPADAPSVITVGAVDKDKNIAAFSSFGPTADKRIKPEILAQGLGAAVINHTSGSITSSNGTSFSSPIMAGLIACLNQNDSFLLKKNIEIFKSKNNNEYLKEAVYKSADKYSSPTAQYGYGIPNFELALNTYISSTASLGKLNLKTISIAPNPVLNYFKIENIEGSIKEYSIYIFNLLGKQVLQKTQLKSNYIDISFLENGVYLLRISTENKQETVKIIKR